MEEKVLQPMTEASMGSDKVAKIILTRVLSARCQRDCSGSVSRQG